tara:strand:+ start:476 stop:1072 length:597 start_codon:yes stop_codon:yes gene_type:complete
MNLKNKIIKKNILNFKKIEYSKWNNKIFKYLLFLLSNDNYKKYKDILLIIFDEFLFYNEYGGGNLLNIENLKEIKNKFNDPEINLIEYYNNLEKITKDKENKEKIDLEKKINNEIKCSEHNFDCINFESIFLDILDFKFISFGIALFIIFFICFIKNIFSFKTDYDKKNIFQFKIPLEDNLLTNSILKYFLGENFNPL